MKSITKEYVKSFLKHPMLEDTDILEIHNRPNYIKQIKENYNKKIFLYFHNDPLSMNGSRTEDERSYLIKNVDKLIFNSKWSRDRFFLNSSLASANLVYSNLNQISILL